MGPGRALVAVAGCLLLSCGLAAGDGKFFSAADDVREPHQKALLWVENGRETLILQVKYEGAAGEFGWVVPVPGRPKIDTAPSELFYELALVTQPIVVRVREGMGRGARASAGAVEGVEVVERLQVGPYDATVLAATDEGALANWLREHGYQMPPRAEEVLASYVERGWYYVALRIDTVRLRRELLAKLRGIEPKIGSLEEAPDRAAELLVRLAEKGEPSCLDIARKIGEIVDEPLGGAEERRDLRESEPHSASGGRVVPTGGPAHQETMYGEMMIGAADRVLAAAALRRMDPLRERDVMECMGTCAGVHGASKVKEAASAVGIPGDGSLADVSRGLAALANRDLSNDVPYGEAEWRRYVQFLTHLRPGAPLDRSAYEHDYEVVRELMRDCRRLPPPEQRDLVAGTARDLGIRTDMLMGAAGLTVLDYARKRSELYHLTREAVVEASGAVEKALESGSIQPLLLEFTTRELVYPLYITSLSPGETDVQLYVLSDHRVEASGHRAVYGEQFKTAFAGRLDEERLRNAAILAGFVKPGRAYLTELRAKLDAREMTRDVSFERARTDKEFRETVTADGRLVLDGRAEHPLRRFGWFVGIGVVALVAGIVIGRGLRPKREQ